MVWKSPGDFPNTLVTFVSPDRSKGARVQVRSLTLDVKVWDEAVLTMMEGLGNEAANEHWEAELLAESAKYAAAAPHRLQFPPPSRCLQQYVYVMPPLLLSLSMSSSPGQCQI